MDLVGGVVGGHKVHAAVGQTFPQFHVVLGCAQGGCNLGEGAPLGHGFRRIEHQVVGADLGGHFKAPLLGFADEAGADAGAHVDHVVTGVGLFREGDAQLDGCLLSQLQTGLGPGGTIHAAFLLVLLHVVVAHSEVLGVNPYRQAGLGHFLEHLVHFGVCHPVVGGHGGGHVDLEGHNAGIRLLLDVLHVAFPHVLTGDAAPHGVVNDGLGADGVQLFVEGADAAYGTGGGAAGHIDGGGDTAGSRLAGACQEGFTMGEARVHVVGMGIDAARQGQVAFRVYDGFSIDAVGVCQKACELLVFDEDVGHDRVVAAHHGHQSVFHNHIVFHMILLRIVWSVVYATRLGRAAGGGDKAKD